MGKVDLSNLKRIREGIEKSIREMQEKREQLVLKLEEILEIKEEAKVTFETIKKVANTKCESGNCGEDESVKAAREALAELIKEEMKTRAALGQLDESLQAIETGGS